MNLKNINRIKIILSVLLILCLFDMPYGFYQLVRVLGCVGFAILGFDSKENDRHIEMIIYLVLFVLFQFFIKIPLGRLMWNIVDFIVAIGLLISFYKRKYKGKELHNLP